MSTPVREDLKERWSKFTLMEQMGNIGSEVGRAAKAEQTDPEHFSNSVKRALELFDLTLNDKRWLGRLREVGRVREVFCDAIFGDKQYQTNLSDLERYFMYFALAARVALK